MTDGDGGPKRLFNVHIRDLIVHDDKDPGPGRGEYAVDFGAAGVPSAGGSRARVRWEGSVASHRTYDVAQWTGVVAVPAPAGKLTVGGAGAERDRTGDDELVGGVATFEADRRVGRRPVVAHGQRAGLRLRLLRDPGGGGRRGGAPGVDRGGVRRPRPRPGHLRHLPDHPGRLARPAPAAARPRPLARRAAASGFAARLRPPCPPAGAAAARSGPRGHEALDVHERLLADRQEALLGPVEVHDQRWSPRRG